MLLLLLLYRCGARQSGDLGSSSEALDGILGFGQSNSSMISQLASSGKVSKVFAHCLDSIHGGGIFAIGHVVQPKVKTTPLVPNQYVILIPVLEKGYYSFFFMFFFLVHLSFGLRINLDERWFNFILLQNLQCTFFL